MRWFVHQEFPESGPAHLSSPSPSPSRLVDKCGLETRPRVTEFWSRWPTWSWPDHLAPEATCAQSHGSAPAAGGLRGAQAHTHSPLPALSDRHTYAHRHRVPWSCLPARLYSDPLTWCDRGWCPTHLPSIPLLPQLGVVSLCGQHTHTPAVSSGGSMWLGLTRPGVGRTSPWRAAAWSQLPGEKLCVPSPSSLD